MPAASFPSDAGWSSELKPMRRNSESCLLGDEKVEEACSQLASSSFSSLWWAWAWLDLRVFFDGDCGTAPGLFQVKLGYSCVTLRPMRACKSLIDVEQKKWNRSRWSWWSRQVVSLTPDYDWLHYPRVQRNHRHTRSLYIDHSSKPGQVVRYKYSGFQRLVKFICVPAETLITNKSSRKSIMSLNYATRTTVFVLSSWPRNRLPPHIVQVYVSKETWRQ